MERTKNGRMRIVGTCVECGANKSKFIKTTKEGGSLLPFALASAAVPAVLGGLALDAASGHKISKDIGNAIKRKAIKGAKTFASSSLRNIANKIEGKGLDIHKTIGKIPHGKHGFTLPGHHYTGPYNDLSKQLKYDSNGNITAIYDKPTGKTDAVSMQHDVDYAICKDDLKCKNKADQKMVKSLDAIPWSQRQWGHALARNAIATKAKLGMGTKKSKNGRRR